MAYAFNDDKSKAEVYTAENFKTGLIFYADGNYTANPNQTTYVNMKLSSNVESVSKDDVVAILGVTGINLNPNLQIRHVEIYDNSTDFKIRVQLYNNSTSTVYTFSPTGNQYIEISALIKS